MHACEDADGVEEVLRVTQARRLRGSSGHPGGASRRRPLHLRRTQIDAEQDGRVQVFCEPGPGIVGWCGSACTCMQIDDLGRDKSIIWYTVCELMLQICPVLTNKRRD